MNPTDPDRAADRDPPPAARAPRAGRALPWVVVAPLLVAVTAGARLLLDPLLGEHHPFILMLAAVFFASWCRGWRAGTLALGLGLLAADYLFIHPRGSFGMETVEHQVGLAAYAAVGTACVALTEALHAARRRSEGQAALLRAEAAGHRRTQEALGRAKAELEARVERGTRQLTAAEGHIQEVTARAERLAALVASSEDAIIGKTLDGVVTDWNAGAESLFGYTAAEAVGARCADLFGQGPGGDIARAEERLRRGEAVAPYEATLRTKFGTEIPVSVRTSPIRSAGRLIGLSAIQRDLRAARELQQQLWQSQKAEAVGRLAGGVAHDFNNLLTVINGYAGMLLKGLPAADPAAEPLAEILEAGRRAEGLTRQLLAFGRRQMLRPQELDLNAVVANLMRLLGRLIGEDVRLGTTLCPSLGRVTADPGQVEQVLMNLCVNARDAMPTGGLVTIETAAVTVPAGEAHPAGVPAGRYARLAVTDTGCGMTDAVKDRIFEPFFTTKPVGQGTGLGLSTVFGIVEQSGGHIAVTSAVGRGTRFEVYLPVAGGEAGEGHAADAAPASPATGR